MSALCLYILCFKYIQIIKWLKLPQRGVNYYMWCTNNVSGNEIVRFVGYNYSFYKTKNTDNRRKMFIKNF